MTPQEQLQNKLDDFARRAQLGELGAHATIKAELMNYMFSFAMAVVEASVPEKMTERNLARLSPNFQAETEEEVIMWNACRQQTLDTAKKITNQ